MTTRATSSSRSAPASSATCAPRSPSERRTRRSASPIPAGRPTAARTTSTPIPRSTAPAHHGHPQRDHRELPDLRDGLEAPAIGSASETDTEAIAHLIEEAYQGDIAEAARARTPPGSTGAYALAVMHRDEPDRLVGARKDVPLIVGLGEGESFLASRRRRHPRRHRRVIFLEEGDVADLTPDRVIITDVDGAPVERVAETIEWTIEAAEKGGYTHFILKEIHEQPEALRQSLTGRISRAGRIQAPELEPIARRNPRRHPRGAGCLRHGLLCRRWSARDAIQDWTDLPARVTVGSEFRYDPPPLDERTLVIAVTQSGETADTIAPTRLARERGCPIVAVTNSLGSAITREADAVLFLQAGPEMAVASTKTFVTQVTTLVVLAAASRGCAGACAEAADGAGRRHCAPCPTPRRGPRAQRPGARTWLGATSTPAASCSSGAGRPTRRRSRARSSSRRSATSMPRAMRPAS